MLASKQIQKCVCLAKLTLESVNSEQYLFYYYYYYYFYLLEKSHFFCVFFLGGLKND